MGGVVFERGVTAASAAAGPIFASELMVPVWWESPGLSLAGVGSLLVIFMYALIAGILFSIVPIVVGTATLATFGRRRFWCRNPVLWGATGFAFGCLLAAPFGTAWHCVMLGVPGAACAQIARWGTRWCD